jgi:uncharacterized paraquat-inducible protein A
MTPALVVTCAGCQARVKAPFQMLGQSRPCPRCTRALVIRVAAPQDAPPVLVDGPPSGRMRAG